MPVLCGWLWQMDAWLSFSVRAHSLHSFHAYSFQTYVLRTICIHFEVFPPIFTTSAIQRVVYGGCCWNPSLLPFVAQTPDPPFFTTLFIISFESRYSLCFHDKFSLYLEKKCRRRLQLRLISFLSTSSFASPAEFVHSPSLVVTFFLCSPEKRSFFAIFNELEREGYKLVSSGGSAEVRTIFIVTNRTCSRYLSKIVCCLGARFRLPQGRSFGGAQGTWNTRRHLLSPTSLISNVLVSII